MSNRTVMQSRGLGVRLAAAAAEIQTAQLREKLLGVHVALTSLPWQLLIPLAIGDIIISNLFLTLLHQWEISVNEVCSYWRGKVRLHISCR